MFFLLLCLIFLDKVTKEDRCFFCYSVLFFSDKVTKETDVSSVTLSYLSDKVTL